MLETFHANFARAIGAVAQAPEGGVVVHCLVGRDRTGLVAALLLRVAGVEASAVAADWAESEANLAAELRAWVAAAERASRAKAQGGLRGRRLGDRDGERAG